MTESTAGSGYWYPNRPTTGVDVLNLLRRYRAAEQAMRARTRASMGMGENDLIALRYLLRAQREGRLVLARDLARLLDVSTPSVTALIDRLERSGHVRREGHPTDRRAVVVVATADSDHEVRSTLGSMHQRMVAAVDELDAGQLESVAAFLSGMIAAVEEADAEQADTEQADAEEADAEQADAERATAREPS